MECKLLYIYIVGTVMYVLTYYLYILPPLADNVVFI